MIITKLIGGLGNQMFQYAAGRRLALKHNTPLKLDLSSYKETWKDMTPRIYELKCFNIKADIAEADDLENGAFMRYKEKSFSFDPYLLNAQDNIHIKGYWQSEKYFEDIKGIIAKDFTVKWPLQGENLRLSEQIQGVQSVSVHVRRTDYVSNPVTNEFHGVCSLDYYYNCIEQIARNTAAPHFFVFSDDPAWCTEHVKLSYPVTFVDHNSPNMGYEDLRLMSLCKHNIIANSSFSWWGAWLNENPDKIVFAPQKWFNDIRYDTKYLLPHGWQRAHELKGCR
jgi:hypothetical protein